ncbi:MAG: hypothetical protein IPH78_15020 [Bacteroidetes bacterium]|nr:hypothetical protein [Bacteroidota bacterium]
MLHILQKTFPLLLFAWLLLAGLSGCGAYSGIAGVPPVTPREFLQQQHWIKVEAGRLSFIWSQPSSTLIVYFVGLFYHVRRLYLLHHRITNRWPVMVGIGLLFSGLGLRRAPVISHSDTKLNAAEEKAAPGPAGGKSCISCSLFPL